MRKKKIAISIIFLLVLTVCMLSLRTKAQDGSRLEELIEEIFETKYCRCHNDGQCYSGKTVSLRRKCGSFNKDIEYNCKLNQGC